MSGANYRLLPRRLACLLSPKARHQGLLQCISLWGEQVRGEREKPSPCDDIYTDHQQQVHPTYRFADIVIYLKTTDIVTVSIRFCHIKGTVTWKV